MNYNSGSPYESPTYYDGQVPVPQTWNAWGKAFGRSFGVAWGPLVGVIAPPSPDFYPSGRPQPGKQSRLRRQAKASVRLEIGFAVSSSASLSIGAAVAAGVSPQLESTAGLRLSVGAEIHRPATVSAEADVHDVVLEMLLIDT